MKRFAALYAVLVGVPVLALLAILRLGAGIVPPPSVGGTWRIAADTGVGLENLGDAGVVVISIVQSGKRLDVTAGSDVQPASGRIDGQRVWAERRRDGVLLWRLDARLTDAETLAGEWKVVSAAETVAIPFEARREQSGAVEPKGH